MKGISPGQRRVLVEFRRIARRGVPPTLRELGLALGIRSTNCVHEQLRALVTKGYLRRVGAQTARGLVPTAKRLPPARPAQRRAA